MVSASQFSLLRPVLAALGLLLLAGCAGVQPSSSALEPRMNTIAEGYVRAVLALGEHDPDYVDAYYGPAALRESVRAQGEDVATVERRARELIAQLSGLDVSAEPELMRLRQVYLARQLQALVAHAQRLQGAKLRFEDEARALYDVEVAAVDEPTLQARLASLDALVPGEAPLAERYNAYLERFAIEPGKLEAVMRAAIGEARRRTQSKIALPPGERFELALVKDKPWSAYNWYQGGYHSRIEINTDLPVSVTRAIELAVHEGYPGHHVYNALLEQKLVRERGWIEFSIYPLFSPQSLVAEGTADDAIALAFPLPERIAFVRDVLFPLAGVDPLEAERYVRVAEAGRITGAATIEAARRYRNGVADAEQTVAFLQRYALASEARARQRIRFFDSYGAYIVNYSMGEELVSQYVARAAGTDAARRWAVFEALISSPRLPSGLR